MPTVAVCIPTFNRAPLLERLLERLRAEDVTVLVSDNASEDDTPAVLERAGVPFHRQPVNVGALENVRWLLRNAPDADYVWLLGDDDHIVPGGVEYARALLAERRPAWLFSPHVWAGEDGRTVSGSPRPAQVEEFRDAGDLYRAYHHWLTFMSASVVRRDLLAAAAERPTENRYAPLVWFFRAALDGPCVVADRVLVSGSPDISWADGRTEIVTRHYVGLYDEALHLRLSEDDFGRALDGIYGENYLQFWRERPREELASTVLRFPLSRNLRWFLFALAREDGQREWFEVVRAAAERAGATAAARTALEAGHARFAERDPEGAAALFQQAVNEDPTLGEAWNDLAVALDALGKPGAEELLGVALELDPDDRRALSNRADFRLEAGDAAGAAEDAERLRRL